MPARPVVRAHTGAPARPGPRRPGGLPRLHGAAARPDAGPVRAMPRGDAAV